MGSGDVGRGFEGGEVEAADVKSMSYVVTIITSELECMPDWNLGVDLGIVTQPFNDESRCLSQGVSFQGLSQVYPASLLHTQTLTGERHRSIVQQKLPPHPMFHHNSFFKKCSGLWLVSKSICTYALSTSGKLSNFVCSASATSCVFFSVCSGSITMSTSTMILGPEW